LADNVTFFRAFMWDAIGGVIPEWPYPE